MEPTLVMALARAVERILAVAAGTLAVYCGYRLFSIFPPTHTDSTGRLELPGMKIVFARVGPAAFSTHPLTTARLHAIARALNERKVEFTIRDPPQLVDSLIHDIEGIADILNDVDMRRLQRIRSEQRPLTSIRGCAEWTPAVRSTRAP